jgi:hypothetical protein
MQANIRGNQQRKKEADEKANKAVDSGKEPFDRPNTKPVDKMPNYSNPATI